MKYYFIFVVVYLPLNRDGKCFKKLKKAIKKFLKNLIDSFFD